jgi:hypothetical protein
MDGTPGTAGKTYCRTSASIVATGVTKYANDVLAGMISPNAAVTAGTGYTLTSTIPGASKETIAAAKYKVLSVACTSSFCNPAATCSGYAGAFTTAFEW